MVSNADEAFHGDASAKFILLGEHFIVHGGVPALAFPVRKLKTQVDLSPQPPSAGVRCEAVFEDRDGHIVELPAVGAAMGRCLHLAADLAGINLNQTGLYVRSCSNFPISRGFGSSASFAMALARALGLMNPSCAERIPQIVHKLEEHFHGNPSGVDAATILTGQPIRFEDKRVVATIRNHAVDFILLNSGERVGCKELVAEVSRNRLVNPERWSERAAVMASLVDKCQQGLASGQSAIVADAVRVCHEILRGMGLSTRPIEIVLEEGRRFGALAGKVSGAGAGGAVVLIARPGEGEDVANKMLDQGFDVLAVEKAHDATTSLGN